MLLLALQAAVAVANGWEVHQAESFCYMWLPSAQGGGVDLGLALDTDQLPTLILSNRTWQVKPDHTYRIKVGVDGAAKPRPARALRISSDVMALVAPIDEPGFIQRFEAAPVLRYTIEQPVRLGIAEANGEGSVNLSGAPAALAMVRQCAEGIRRGQRDIARQQVKRALPRRDSHDQQDPGAPPADW